MSIEVMNRVWTHSTQKGSNLLLLLAIADNANNKGEAYPGIDYLSRKVRMSRRQTQRLVQALERSNELAVIWGGAGPRDVNFYFILVGKSPKEIQATIEKAAEINAKREGSGQARKNVPEEQPENEGDNLTPLETREMVDNSSPPLENALEKGDILPPLEKTNEKCGLLSPVVNGKDKDDILTPFENVLEQGDILSPFGDPDKGFKSGEKGDISGNKGVKSNKKGDIAVSPEPLINHKSNHQGESGAQDENSHEKNGLTPARSTSPLVENIPHSKIPEPHPDAVPTEVQLYQRVTGRLPRRDQWLLIVRAWKDKPYSLDILLPFWEAWVARDHKRTSLGWLDWVERRAIPEPWVKKSFAGVRTDEPNGFRAIQQVVEEYRNGSL